MGGRTIAKIGRSSIVTIIAPNPPIDTIRIASFDLPSKTILCPGRTVSAVPSSGTPKSIEGTNSKRACAMDIETIRTQRNSELTKDKSIVETANNIAPAVFTCIPGVIPVIVPITTPNKHAITNSNIAIN